MATRKIKKASGDMKFSQNSHRVYLSLFVLLSFAGSFAGTPGYASANGEHLSLEFLDGRLTLAAENAALREVLAGLHENSVLEYEIPERYLDIAISVSFHELPLDKGIQRIFRGLSYACVMHDGKLAKVIVVPEGEASQKDFSDKPALNAEPAVERSSNSVSTPTVEAVIKAMNAGEIELPDEIIGYLKGMGDVSFSEAMDMAKHIRITPFEQEGDEDNLEARPSLEELEKIIGNVPEGF